MNLIKINISVGLLLASTFTTLYAAPNTEGQWSQQADWPMIPIHAVLTPEGKVLTWGVDGISSGQFKYDVWNPDNGLGTTSHDTITSNIGVSSFCSAGLLLPETGNVLMPGGDARPEGATNSGITSVAEFNTQNNGLSRAAEMSYPKLWVVPDGRVFGMQNQRMYYITSGGQGTLTTAGTLPLVSRGNSSTAVMYSPGRQIVWCCRMVA